MEEYAAGISLIISGLANHPDFHENKGIVCTALRTPVQTTFCELGRISTTGSVTTPFRLKITRSLPVLTTIAQP
jgi:hypothetical protein